MPTVMGDLIPAIGYIRVSTAREEMISPELQRKAILAWAKRTGRRIIDWVEDLDATGRNFKRKIMQAIARVEAGEAKEIAVWKYSRFGRTRTGIEINLARIEQAGGQLQSATEDVDATTATGWFQRDVIFSVATFESKRAGEQWEETHAWRRGNGLPASGRPRFGYTWYPRKIYGPDGSVTLQEERYEPDPSLADLIKELYRRYVAGEGFKQLAVLLNSQAILTVRGGLWCDATLRKYMDSGFPAGYLRIHDPSCSQPYRSECPNHLLIKHPKNHHPEIISEETWQAYLQRRAQVKATAPRARRATYPLSALTRCGLCNGAARRTTSVLPTAAGPTMYAYFVCNHRKTKGPLACEGVRVSGATAEAYVRDWLADLVASEIEAAADSHVALRRSDALVDRQERSLERLRARREQLSRAISKHMRTYALADDDDTDGSLEQAYIETLRELRAEKEQVAGDLAALELEAAGEESQSGRRRAAAVTVALGLVSEWGSLPPDRINVLLRQVIRHLVIRPGGEFAVVPTWEPA